MKNRSNEEFEESLKEIMDAGPESTRPRPLSEHDEKSPISQPPKKSPKIPRWLEMVIRLVAALIVAYLLLMFGAKVSSM